MSLTNTVEAISTVKTTVVFSKNRKDRYLLKENVTAIKSRLQ